MDSATLQSRIYKGYGKVALRIGPVYTQYRPRGPANPLATAYNRINASFNAEDMTYGRPNKYGKPTWYCVFDGSEAKVGDYLVGKDGTFFIAAMQMTLPILCVECNRKVRISRMAAPLQVGAVGYSAIVEGAATDVLGVSDAAGNLVTGWPGSILIGGRSDKVTDIGGAVKSSGWQALLPPSVPITIMQGDILHDDLNRKYAVYAAELTDLGWRLNINEVHS